ncbi:MAG: rhomboid family intramembrane serine protease, partial [bacterium]
MTPAEFVRAAAYQLAADANYELLVDAYPETAREARDFDGALATADRGDAVVVAFKAADALGYAQVVWWLNRLLALVPRPAALDALGYRGVLVLVFERELDPVKRDRLLALRRRRWWHRGAVAVVVVELAAREATASRLPRALAPLLDWLGTAARRRTDPPEMPIRSPRVGQIGARSPIVFTTLALVAILSLIHVVVFLWEPDDSLLLRLYRSGARQGTAIRDGEIWRDVTANFLHGSWDHLIGNVTALFEYGRIVEPLFGSAWTLAAFVGTGIAASLFSGMVNPDVLAVGASTSVMGFAGIILAVFAFRRERISLRFHGHFARLFRLGLILNGWSVFLGALGRSNVDNWGHLGGLLSGFALGSVMPFAQGASKRRAGPLLAVAAAALCLLSAGAVIGRWEAPAQPFLRVRDHAPQGEFERPLAFLAARDEHALVVTNRTYTSLTVRRDGDQVAWMFEQGLERMRAVFADGLARGGRR